MTFRLTWQVSVVAMVTLSVSVTTSIIIRRRIAGPFSVRVDPLCAGDWQGRGVADLAGAGPDTDEIRSTGQFPVKSLPGAARISAAIGIRMPHQRCAQRDLSAAGSSRARRAPLWTSGSSCLRRCHSRTAQATTRTRGTDIAYSFAQWARIRHRSYVRCVTNCARRGAEMTVENTVGCRPRHPRRHDSSPFTVPLGHSVACADCPLVAGH